MPGHLLPLSKALIISSPLGAGCGGWADYPSSYHVAALLSQSLILSLEDPSLAHQDVLSQGRCKPSFQPKQQRAQPACREGASSCYVENILFSVHSDAQTSAPCVMNLRLVIPGNQKPRASCCSQSQGQAALCACLLSERLQETGDPSPSPGCPCPLTQQHLSHCTLGITRAILSCHGRMQMCPRMAQLHLGAVWPLPWTQLPWGLLSVLV